MFGDGWGPAEPWIGVLDVVGVVIAFVAWFLLRDARERGRAIATVTGGTMLAFALVGAVGDVNRGLSLRLGFTAFDGDGGYDSRLGIVAALALAGLAVGIVAVFEAHRRLVADDDEEDEYEDDDDEEAERYSYAGGVTEVLGDAEPRGDDEPEDEPFDDRDAPRPLTTAAWIELAAVAVAVALPTLGRAGVSFYGGTPDVDSEVTVTVALSRMLAGLLVALPLLVIAGRDDADDPRVVGAAFGLVGLGVLVLPIWPGPLTNELWSVFAAGLATGLLAAVTFALLRRAVRVDRVAATAGVVAACALLVVSNVVTVKVVRDRQQVYFDQLGNGIDGSVDFAP